MGCLNLLSCCVLSIKLWKVECTSTFLFPNPLFWNTDCCVADQIYFILNKLIIIKWSTDHLSRCPALLLVCEFPYYEVWSTALGCGVRELWKLSSRATNGTPGLEIGVLCMAQGTKQLLCATSSTDGSVMPPVNAESILWGEKTFGWKCRNASQCFKPMQDFYSHNAESNVSSCKEGCTLNLFSSWQLHIIPFTRIFPLFFLPCGLQSQFMLLSMGQFKILLN